MKGKDLLLDQLCSWGDGQDFRHKVPLAVIVYLYLKVEEIVIVTLCFIDYH